MKRTLCLNCYDEFQPVKYSDELDEHTFCSVKCSRQFAKLSTEAQTVWVYDYMRFIKQYCPDCA